MIDQAVVPERKRKRKLVHKMTAQNYDQETATSEEENSLQGLLKDFCLNSNKLVLIFSTQAPQKEETA